MKKRYIISIIVILIVVSIFIKLKFNFKETTLAGTTKKYPIVIKINERGDIVGEKKILEYNAGNTLYSIPYLGESGYILSWQIKKEEEETNYKYVKVNQEFEKEWELIYDNDINIAEELDSNNNFLVFDESESNKALIQKIDQNGNIIFDLNFHKSEGVRIRDIFEIEGEGFIAAGSAEDNKGFVMKLDTKGNQIWKKTYDIQTFLIKDLNDGGYYIIGRNKVLKIDYEGEKIWVMKYTYDKLIKYIDNM